MTGTYEHALDTKSRLSMPARLREEIGDCFHLAMGADECLTIYPQAAWEDLCRRADELEEEEDDDDDYIWTELSDWCRDCAILLAELYNNIKYSSYL